MTSLAEAFGLGRGCFGREGVLRCTGTFPESHRLKCLTGWPAVLLQGGPVNHSLLVSIQGSGRAASRMRASSLIPE